MHWESSSFKFFGGLGDWKGDFCLERFSGFGFGFTNSSERNFWKSLVLARARRSFDWFSLLALEGFIERDGEIFFG